MTKRAGIRQKAGRVTDVEHVVLFSGGLGSWCAAERVIAEHGKGSTTLLFTDTTIEDEDLYRFLDDSEIHFGCRMVRLKDGRDPWEVFKDERFIGNTRADPCSKILKRKMADRWVKANCSQAATIYLGIDWTESHRFDGARKRWQPLDCQAPMCERPYLSKFDMADMVTAAGLTLPRLYRLGFPHNNCGGFCVKAGIAHFVHLLRTMPERYQVHEEKEQALRSFLGRDVSILRDRAGGVTKPLTLKTLRERTEKDSLFGQNEEWGGCGCFS